MKSGKFVLKKKHIYINVAILAVFFVPTILFRYHSHYECQAGVFGMTKTMIWEAKADKYKQAAALSIEKCKKNSDRPDRCDVLSCKNYFF